MRVKLILLTPILLAPLVPLHAAETKSAKGFYTVRHFMEGITMPGAEVL